MILDNGVARFVRPDQGSGMGDIPSETGKIYHHAWYATRTVGIHRFFEARQAGQRIDRLIRILRPSEAEMVWADDICMLGQSDQRYRVVQAQELTDEESGEEVMDISLERMAGIWL